MISEKACLPDFRSHGSSASCPDSWDRAPPRPASPRLTARRTMAWSSLLTAASATSSIRPASDHAPNSKRRCATTSRSTTTTFRNAPSTIKRPFRPSRNGAKSTRNCSGNACITSRVLKIVYSAWNVLDKFYIGILA